MEGVWSCQQWRRVWDGQEVRTLCQSCPIQQVREGRRHRGCLGNLAHIISHCVHYGLAPFFQNISSLTLCSRHMMQLSLYLFSEILSFSSLQLDKGSSRDPHFLTNLVIYKQMVDIQIDQSNHFISLRYKYFHHSFFLTQKISDYEPMT